jgi:hypothetical protein
METVISKTPPQVLQDDFIVATNEDWTRDWQLKDEGELIRIEDGWKLYMQLQNIKDGALSMTNSTDNARLVVLDRDSGTYGLRVKAAEADQIPPGQYKYDIVLVAGNGIFRLVKGTVQIDQGITNVPGQEKWSHFPLILRP